MIANPDLLTLTARRDYKKVCEDFARAKNPPPLVQLGNGSDEIRYNPKPQRRVGLCLIGVALGCIAALLGVCIVIPSKDGR